MLGQADVGGPGTANDAYMEALATGGSAQDAWQTAEQQHLQSILGGRGTINEQGWVTTDFEFDWLGNSLWIQGFDPNLTARAQLRETFNEVLIGRGLSEGTTSNFAETIGGTTGNDTLVGTGLNSAFRFTQVNSV